jgi:signal peptidase I
LPQLPQPGIASHHYLVAKRSRKPLDRPKNLVAAVRAKNAPRRRPGTSLWEHTKGILGAVLIFLVLRTVVVEAYRIPSGSMIPSLLIGDWLFVNKLVYGPHIPFTNINLPGYSEPHRFDIVVFVSPTQYDQMYDPNPTLVKRLIGMPGDTLFMRDGKLFVDGIEQRQGYGANSPKAMPSDYVDPDFDWQKRVGLTSSRFGPAPAQPTLDNWGPFVVPAKHYFMMGDNRYCSKDSRYWSFVPRENIRGRPLFVYYSYRPGPGDDGPECAGDVSTRSLSFITDIRWGRIGHWIR